MEEFSNRDLRGARLDAVDLTGAFLEHVDLTGAQLRSVDFTGALIRGAGFTGARIIDVEFTDVEIDGDVRNVTVNGVDIAPLVEAELDRRMPDRVKMRPEDADGFREAWQILERLWGETIARARTFPEASLNVRVNDEWSFVQTLRHLNFACAAWVNRAILGDPSPYHPLDLPFEDARDLDGVTWDVAARPSLDEVLEIRRTRDATVREVLATLTDEELSHEVTRSGKGWPKVENFTIRRCLRVILNEEWEHRRYAERDLTLLTTT